MRLNTSKELGFFSSGVQLLVFFFQKKKDANNLCVLFERVKKKVFQETPKCAIIKASLVGQLRYEKFSAAPEK